MINSIQADSYMESAATNAEPFATAKSPWLRRGSLPLKKRRLYHAIPLWESESSSSQLSKIPSPLSHPLSSSAPSLLSSESSSLRSHESHNGAKQAAFLALVAAATTGQGKLETEPPRPEHQSASQDIKDDSLVGSSNLQSSQGPKEDACPSLVPIEGGSAPAAANDKDGAPRANHGRIHHPPLLNPLPNGCHGRTSRNNSYCRRQPRYKGSKYCKLHYQHYILAGRTSSDAEADPAPTSCVIIDGGVPDAVVSTQSHGSSAAATSQQQQQQQQQQDKRYTGTEDEIRCEATTTRGRACAYVAVQGTKYCYLHADYDINPPPRRGGASSSQKPKTPTTTLAKRVSLVGAESFPTESVDMASNLLLNKTNYSSPPSVTSEESFTPTLLPSSNSHGGLEETTEFVDRTKTKVASRSKLVETLYPLLSSISPDQWYGKRVMIATGPLVSRTGTVEKWGNGWVGVRVSFGSGEADPHLHNRRALELYLLPDQDEDRGRDENDDAVLRRCVSREADTPLMKLEDYSDDEKVMDAVVDHSNLDIPRQNATPSMSSDMECDEPGFRSRDDDETIDETPRDLIPESPRTPAPGLTTVGLRLQNCCQLMIPRNDYAGFSEDMHYPHTSSTASVTVTPKPSSPRHDRCDDELPLVQGMLLTHDARKHNFDLLFGTAALERSRRTVYKPQRYEDKAMLAKKRARYMMEGEDEVDAAAAVAK